MLLSAAEDHVATCVCFDSVPETHDPSEFPGVIEIIHCSVSNVPIALAIFAEVSLWIQQLQDVQNVELTESVEILVILAIPFLAGPVEPVAYGEFLFVLCRQ
ncbi:MAG: hypothetical protein ACTTI9_07685 [Schaalia odontolytica]